MNSIINKNVHYLDFGLIDYQEAWDHQETLFNETVAVKLRNRQLEPGDQLVTPNYLVFCQHPHVYTLGKSGSDRHLLLNKNGLKRKGVSFYHINRGGDITYHGPGQIVVYPILDLDNFFTDIHLYLRTMEEAVIRTIAQWGIPGIRIEKLTGVWVEGQGSGQGKPEYPASKICAFGVRASRWITMHGLALNVNNDLSYFDHIVPCGIADKGVTSMAQELGHPLQLAQVQEALRDHLIDLFDMRLIDEPVGRAAARNSKGDG